MSEDKPRLLIVEDDLGLQKQLKWCFDEYEVLFSATRSEALAQLRRFEPPVVLQDLGLPPDPEACRRGCRRARDPDAAPQTKVIVVTGNHDRETRCARFRWAPTTSIRSRSIPTSCDDSCAARSISTHWRAEPGVGRGASCFAVRRLDRTRTMRCAGSAA